MTIKERHELVERYLGQTVQIKIDRPIGHVHKKGEKTLIYPINYGYIPKVLGGDGEELDVYLLGADRPLVACTCRIVGIVYRENDVEDKLIASADGRLYSADEMAEAIRFQEQYYRTQVRALKDIEEPKRK